jgi:hypothetical protein
LAIIRQEKQPPVWQGVKTSASGRGEQETSQSLSAWAMVMPAGSSSVLLLTVIDIFALFSGLGRSLMAWCGHSSTQALQPEHSSLPGVNAE